MAVSSLTRVSQSDLSKYVLILLSGYCSFGLKLSNMNSILVSFGMEYFSLLALFQGITIFAANKLFEKYSSGYPSESGALLYLFGAIITFVGPAPASSSLTFSLLQFLTSSMLISLLDISLHHFISHNLSLLKNPKTSTKAALVAELGAFGGALLTLCFGVPSGSPYVLAFTLSLFVGCASLLIFLKRSAQELTEKPKLRLVTEMKSESYPFGTLLVGLFTVLLCLKQLQGFTVLIGLEDLRGPEGAGISAIFSKYSLVQTGIILGILSFSLINPHRRPTWTGGVKSFLWVLVISMVTLLIFPNPFLFLASGAIRKIWQHSFLDESIKLLTSSIPSSVRTQLRNSMERFGNLIAYSTLSFISYLSINVALPISTVWGLTLCLCGLGLLIHRKLFFSLSTYHAKNLVHPDPAESINSCHTLANKESVIHVDKMLALLEQRPRASVLKALIHSLGSLRSEQTIRPLIKLYHETKREDLHLPIIQALSTFDSLEVNHFFTKCMVENVKEYTSLGEVRHSIFILIAKKLGLVSTYNLMTIIDENPQDHRIVANALCGLGEIAIESKNAELFNYLASFLSSGYHRRIKTNCALYLIRNNSQADLTTAYIEQLQNSTDEHDRSSFAYLIGELELKTHRESVFLMSEGKKHDNSTLLISLLKLGHKSAPGMIMQHLLFTCNEPLTVINQLHGVNDIEKRLKIYSLIFDHHPGRIKEVLNLLVHSRKDFDEDRQILYREAKRLNLDIGEDAQLPQALDTLGQVA